MCLINSGYVSPSRDLVYDKGISINRERWCWIKLDLYFLDESEHTQKCLTLLLYQMSVRNWGCGFSLKTALAVLLAERGGTEVVGRLLPLWKESLLLRYIKN